MKLRIKGSYVIQKFVNLRRFLTWAKNGYQSPSPQSVKKHVLMQNVIKKATWVETGTYLGTSTKLFSKLGVPVFSVEPQFELFDYNLWKFRNRPNVTIIHGTSEDVFPNLLPKLSGSINFWLDGHFSSGDTFKGENETPIKFELQAIEDNLDSFQNIAVFIDDIRCFGNGTPEYSTYPSLDFLVSWANRNSFNWTIQNDIFIAIKHLS